MALFMALSMAIGFFAMPRARAEEGPTVSNTTATVTFLDGELSLEGEAQGSGMNFHFGQHHIPAKAATYTSENQKEGAPVSHILYVTDSRYDSGDWHVTVSLSNFMDTQGELDPFGAMIRLQNPVISNQNTSAGTEGLTIPSDIQIFSEASAIPVMEADGTLPRGIFSALWENQGITLNISDSEVSKIGLSNYSADLIWTLNLGPR